MPSLIFLRRLRLLLSLAAFSLCGLLLSAPAPAQAPNPVPVITSLSPSGVVADGPSVKLTISGTGLISDSHVVWNNQFLPTTLVTDPNSPPHLVATVDSLLMTDIGTFNVSVINPTPGGGTSNTQNFVITAPVPTISILSPNGVVAGSQNVTLTVNGNGFVSSSVIEWNGQPLATFLVPSVPFPPRLVASLSSAQVAAVGTATITVVNPAPDGGTSNAQTYSIVAPSPTPVLTALSPAHVTEGGPDFTLTVTGTGFDATSIIHISVYPYSLQGLPTTFVSPTQITAIIPAVAIGSLFSQQIQVVNGVSGISYVPSNTLTLTVDPPPYPLPTITALSPTSVPAGTGAFTLHITGTGFNKDTQVKFGAHYIYFVGGVTSTGMDVGIPAGEVPAAAGTSLVTVSNPSSGPGFGGTSNAVLFTFSAPLNPVPVVTGLSPNRATQGDPDLTVAVTGSSFLPSSQVQWNGAALATTYVSATSLTAVVPAALLTAPGSESVGVFTPAPGGGPSAYSPSFVIAPRPNPVPTISTLTPDHCPAGLGSFRVHITGTNIVPGAWALVNGSRYQVVEGTVTGTGLDIILALNDLQKLGTLQVAVVNPDNQGAGGGTSNALPFTVTLQPFVNDTHLLWNNVDGRVMLWSLDGLGRLSVNGFGPYTGLPRHSLACRRPGETRTTSAISCGRTPTAMSSCGR